MNLELSGAAVCVSGGTKGLGRAVAVAFARESARVVVTARDQEGIDRTVAALHEAGAPDAFGIRADVADPQAISAAFGQIGERWGELNTLINMVGPTAPSSGANFAEVPDDQWTYYWEVGVMSAVRCTRAAVGLMRNAGWGRVVNISSISSRLGLAMEAPYMTAKSGLNGLSRNMAAALAPDGILVNTVTPGVFRTEALVEFMRATGVTDKYDPDNPQDVWSWMTDVNGGRHAGMVGRVALPEELCPLVLLLGSTANSYIVGANIPVDGGTDFSLV